MIETDKSPAMVMLLGELSPAMILEMRDGFDGVVGKIGYVLNKYLDYQSYVVEPSPRSSDYKWVYQKAFDEQSSLSDVEIVSDLERAISDEGDILIAKIREVIEAFRMKSE